MKKTLLLFLIVLLGNISFSQISHDSLLFQIEDFFLSGDEELYDAEKFNQLDTSQSNYSKVLFDLIHNKKPNYKHYYQFMIGLRERRPTLPYSRFSEFIDREIKTPSNKEQLDYFYVKMIFTQVSELSNLSLMKEALERNVKLQEYVDQFDSTAPEVKKAQILVDNHQSVLHQIQHEIEKGMELALKNETIARSLNDTDLIIMSLYQQSDFFVAEQKVDEFIVVCEEGLRLDEMQQVKSSFYRSLMSHLIDAYIYKGGKLERVKELLKALENANYYKLEVISYYGKLLRFANPKEDDIQFILDRFEAKDVLEAAHKAVQETEDSEDQNAFFHVLKEFAGALLNYNFKEAEKFYNRAIFVNQQIYSEGLSKSLAENKTTQIRKEKELEVANEKEKNKLYMFIIILIGVFFIGLIFVLFIQKKQSRLLAEKNLEIETALHEKQLLLKEVHHRVKNNFQIVSSLLELQTKGIEDPKAKSLAQEGKNRVKSMALIHQKLYQNDDLLIYFDDYIDKLVKEISDMYGAEKKADISIQVPKVAFDIDTAIPLGLIVNELVTNAFKYALNDEQSKLKISIEEEKEGDYKLEVKDNGNGMPTDFNLSKAKSLGLRLIKSLSKQLHGNVSYTNNNGAVFQVMFKNTIARASVE